jgi:hypothetical protein
MKIGDLVEVEAEAEAEVEATATARQSPKIFLAALDGTKQKSASLRQTSVLKMT